MHTILQVHTLYRWPGGEDRVVGAEAALLRAHGHAVVQHVADNKEILKKGRLATALALWETPWSRRVYEETVALLAAHKPDVVHAHNLWYALSPSLLSACHDTGVPVVMTLHNMRLLCPGGVFLSRQGQPCRLCQEKSAWTGAWRRCYHGSFAASAAVARLIEKNRKRGTWNNDVDLFLVPSAFCREAYSAGGFPAERIVVKPNFLDDPLADGVLSMPEAPRALFVGRLSEEKGLRTLLRAWRYVESRCDAELRLVGDGPLREELAREAEGSSVSFTGQLVHEDVLREIGRAQLLVQPSTCYESFGLTVVEGFAMGRPAVVTGIGALPELVADGAGLSVVPGDAEALAAGVSELLFDPERCRRAGVRGREIFRERFTPEANYRALFAAYEWAAKNASGEK